MASPVLRTSSLPFFHDTSKGWVRDDGKSAMVAGLFERFRMVRCAYFPTHEPSGLRGAVYDYRLDHSGLVLKLPTERLFTVDGIPRERFVPRAETR